MTRQEYVEAIYKKSIKDDLYDIELIIKISYATDYEVELLYHNYLKIM